MQCGEQAETVNHILFQCSIAREIWELAPLLTPPGDLLNAQTLEQNLQALFQQMPKSLNTVSLVPFIGWNIWKARNAFIFNNKRDHITDIISRSLMECNLWEQVIENLDDATGREACRPRHVTKDQLYNNCASYVCLVDASWLSKEQPAGIAWKLHQKGGRSLIQGKAAI